MLVIVPRSGIAGDMLLSALIDVGADEKTISAFLRKELSVNVSTTDVMSGGIRGKRLAVPNSSKEFSPGEMKKIISISSLGEHSKRLALSVLETIVEAEKRMHKTDDVHFHELANIDTLIDIMGCCFALELLEEENVLSISPNVGRIQPAALDILTRARFPFYSSTDALELTTPTGAALLSSIAKPIDGIPQIISERVGHGAGNFKLEKEPNVLRVILGDEPDKSERMAILETNLDDISGEIIAHATERLFEEGARDVCLIPIIAKKGRPGVILRAIVSHSDKDKLARVIFEETGTLGVRESDNFRHIASRSTIKNGEIRLKIGKINGRTISEKPEFEDLKKLSKKTKRPVRELSRGISR
jgi:pyridinium-3,5-bisthiocarboxylic acid mononucleotide nickel chelatase